MNPTAALKAILSNQYVNEDEEEYTVELLPGMRETELAAFKRRLPNQFLPPEIEELLRFSTGFLFSGLEKIRFDAFDEFGFEELFPRSIQLAGDGYGNFWVLDLDAKGNWGPVYYVCHDPAVVVKHSDSLAHFIKDVDEFGRLGSASKMDKIHEEKVFTIWEAVPEFTEQHKGDLGLPQSFLQTLPAQFMIADLTKQPVGTGFAWGKSGANPVIVRFEDKPIWVLERKAKKGFLSRLFGSK
ncbi:SMI1/KNR4 family protein [Sabulibacter ruber]|uniref:SMI1/KNR4 family protein n=1 Tax=Sabulibacter ruber TaxID=2811901 RepID=UPI001A96E213|nr:SMI1/KNR4 family protein [Sabulibacter ruber]